jgi:quercetin dioxygenase-like cupin family protein
MNKEAQYYPKDKLNLKTVGDGAKMWGVPLEKTLLTYFEVEPNSEFAMHRHENEQITLVLEGELFFKVDGREIKVGPGEVIALPANVEHGAFTREKPAKAVDAWSPVMEKYRND